MKTRPMAIFGLMVGVALLVTFIPSRAVATPTNSQSSNFTNSEENMVQSSSVMFIENVGQFNEGARFRAFGGQYNLWLAEDALWFALLEPSPKVSQPEDGFRKHDHFLRLDEEKPRLGVAVKLTFPGANPNPQLEPFNRLDTVVSYFIGNDPAKWHPDVPVWGGVRYTELYPGVDLEVTSKFGRWTWQMIARDGAYLSAVTLRVEGVDKLATDGNHLNLTTAVGNLTLPLLTADWSGPTGAIAGHEVLRPFTSPVDHSPTRLQDNPDDLLYSTFLGGNGGEEGEDIAVDGSRAAYITGYTESSDFPTTPGAFDASHNANFDAFVVKLNPSGSALAYATFLGGYNSDWSYGIAVDESGAAYVTGETWSSDFPTTPGAFDTTYNSYEDAFVAKLNATGSGLVYSTFLGGDDEDLGWRIAVDGSGNVYVTGETGSSDFPTTVEAYDTTYNGGGDAFVLKLNTTGSALTYATFLGGSDYDEGSGIVIDGSGAAYVTGWTYSSHFPTTPGAFDPTFNGYCDTFVVKLSPSGSTLAYATFLGGGDDEGYGIAVDGSGAVYVTGGTYSSHFPTTPGAFDPTFNGYCDTFVVKLSPSGSTLAYATFLGGVYGDYSEGIAVDGSGAVYVTGWTYSSDFPTTPGAFDTVYNGYYADAFVVKLNTNGSALTYATFLGGGSGDVGSAIAVDGEVSTYVTGFTDSPDFFTTAGVFDTSFNGSRDVFVAKLAMGDEPGPTPTRPPVVLVHGWQVLGTRTRRCNDGAKRLTPGVSHTFGEMAQWFVNSGYDVWVANLDSGPLHTPTIEQNAQCLKNQIASVRQQTGQKVILVGHSMGGLVSRACLSLDDCRDNVAAFYTLGSPHAGVNSAFLLKLLAYLKVPVAEEMVCQWQPALCQFTTDGMLWFNLFNPNRNGTAYNFIGGTKTPFPLGWLLLPFDGPNDGVVGSYSAVGWLYPTKLNVVRGPEASRYWTNEAHTRGFGSPTYFEASGGPESEAFRCIARGDCLEADSLVLNAAQTEPTLSAATVDVIGHLASGQSVSHTLQVDTSDHSLFYLSWLTGTLEFSLTNPVGTVIDPAYATANTDVVTYTTSPGSEMTPPFAVYAFTSTVPGHYIVTISANEVGSEGTGYLAFATLETDRTFSVSTDAELYQVGDTAVLTGTLQGPLGGITGADVQVRFTRMDSMVDTLTLADLGDGTYKTIYIVPDAAGYLQATFTATGDDAGTTFNRQVDELLAIAPYAAQLTDTYADQPEDRDDDGFDDTLALDVGVTATQVGTYTLSADLVASGEAVAHTTEYTVLATGTQTVTLGFDGWDIRRSQINGPYTVTHLSLVDLGVAGIPAQMADDVWLTAAYKWQEFGFERLYLPLIMRNR